MEKKLIFKGMKSLLFTALLAILAVSCASSEEKKAQSEADYAEAMEAFEVGNYEQMLDLCEKAAKNNHKDAQYHLGKCYDEGYGVMVDFKKAFKWYEKASINGHTEAIFQVGIMYYSGSGVEKNREKGKMWIKEAAEKGHKIAIERMSEWADYGSERLHWIQKAAEIGYDKAQLKLGEYYEEGTGVEKNYEKALYWYEEAKKNGNLAAQVLIDRLHKKIKREGISL